jgi:hypothetical protein
MTAGSGHTHHDPLSAGSRCIECHMPKTGNSCHADKTPQWALSEASKWYPKLK